MAFSSVQRSQAFLGDRALIVSNDSSVSGPLKQWLAEDFQCQATQADLASESVDSIVADQGATLFVDLRVNGTSPESLLRQIASRRNRSASVIGLLDGGFHRDVAWLASSAIHTWLEIPLNRQELSQMVVSDQQAAAQLPPIAVNPMVVETPNFIYTTNTPQMFPVLERLVTMAQHDVTILLVGETGTGKTTIARVVHDLSSRAEEIFLTVACGALPPDLIESELFGHMKGSFTGAERDKTGKFEVADRGSLLLDEIDVLGPGQQAKLLRVIETGEFERVGSNDTLHSQARLIVASNVDLTECMKRDDFRADLYYRLSVLEFHIPPLRDRPLDIIPLTIQFIEEFCRQHDVQISGIHPEFLELLTRYQWPGNIRELKNHIRRSVLFCRTGELTPDDMAPCLVESTRSSQSTVGTNGRPATLFERVATTEQEILESALRDHGYNRTETARSLGISRVGLYKKMKKYGMINARRKS